METTHTFFEKRSQNTAKFSSQYGTQFIDLPKKKKQNQITIRSIKVSNKQHKLQNPLKQQPEDKQVELYLHSIDRVGLKKKLSVQSSDQTSKINLRFQDVSNTQYDQVPYASAYQLSKQPAFFDVLMNIQKDVREAESIRSEKNTRFGRRFSLYKNVEVMKEEQIINDYRFKLPVLIAEFEGDNNFLHMNEGFHQSYDFILNCIDNVKNELEKVKQEKQLLKEQFDQLDHNYNQQIDHIICQYPQNVLHFKQIMQNNFVEKQSENFMFQKTIVAMKKEFNNNQQDIEKSLWKIRRMENSFYGVELFELQTDDQMLNQIPQINLRKDVMKICTSKNQKKHNYIIH